MSGGYFDYKQYQIDQIADEIEQLILSNDDESLDEHGLRRGRGYSDEVIAKFADGLIALRVAAAYAQRIDWLVSDDDGEESFLRRLEDQLGKITKVAADVE